MSLNQGNYDNAANAPYWAVNSAICKAAPSRVQAAPTDANVAYLYGNTAPSAYITDATLGLFMVDSTEETAGGDNVVDISIIQGGSGYVEVPAVAFSGGGGSGAAATAYISGGVVTKILVTNGGSSYETVPTVNINVPRLTIPTANVNTSTETITYTGHGLSAGEQVKYYKVGSGTAIAGLTDATSYYAGQVTANSFKLYDTRAHGTTAVATLIIATSGVNTTTNTFTSNGHGLVNGAQVNYSNQGGSTITGLTSGNDYYIVNATTNTFQLSDTSGGDAIDISTTGNNSQTFASTGNLNLTGQGNNAQYFDKLDQTTATALADKGLGQYDGTNSGWTHATHTGWNIKKVGTGGRAGRVQWETLSVVADVQSDGSDDIALPDA
jgi:hypothetical protein